jgi:hypothetical protein
MDDGTAALDAPGVMPRDLVVERNQSLSESQRRVLS